VQLQSRDLMSLTEIASRLSEVTGIAHITALGPTGARVNSAQLLRTAEDIEAQLEANAPVRPESTLAAGNQSGSAVQGMTIRPNLRGPLGQVLDEIAAAFEIEWFFVDGRVLFQDYVTEQYQVSALATTNSATMAVGSGSMSSSTAIESDVWAEARDALQGIVSDGASLSVSPSTGIVTATATITDQKRIADYIETLNEAIGQQIAFDVYVLTVSLSDTRSAGVDLQAAFNTTGAQVGWTGQPGMASDSVGSANIGLISGNFSLEALVSALSRQGEVSVATRAGTTTSNNRMAPIEVVDNFSYLASVSIDRDASGNDRVNRQAAQEATGFQLQLLPRIMSNREIMLQYSVELSELNELRTFGDGNQAIQLPDISTTSFEQQAIVGNGQTIVMAGFERTRSDYTETRSGSLLGFGGGNEASNERVATVIMITPRVIDRSARR
jgi:type IVB pilus formation R64 PilN family outer membrane protein